MAKPKWKNETERKLAKLFSDIKSRAKKKQIAVIWDVEDFVRVWYPAQKKECCHCGLTEKEIKEFYALSKSKRSNRGKVFEVDRKVDAEYSAGNCVLSCYWCNNAKSDVFNDKEFFEIAKEISKTIRHLLANPDIYHKRLRI